MDTQNFVNVDTQNEPGTLGRLAGILGNEGVNINAFAADANGIRFLTDDPDQTVTLLQDNGLTANAVEVLGINVPDQPGALAQVGQTLGEAGIDIVSTFGCTSQGQGTVYLRVEDVEAATQALSNTPIATTA